MMRLAVVILNYGTADLALDCIRSLEGQLDLDQDCVVVVDNCSKDNSAEIIQTAITENNWTFARLVQSPSNNGFSAGNNYGMQSVVAQAYFLLNTDTIVRPDAVAELLNAFDQNPKAGVISPRLEWPDATPQISCFRHASPFSQLIDSAETGPITKLLHRYNVPIDVSDRPMQPDWTSFAGVLLRREAIEQIGWMDEGYFMYYEDSDFCRRAQTAGWQILHWPEARVVHLRGGTSDVKAKAKARKRRPAYWYAARSRYFAKFYGGVLGLLAANLGWHIGRAISLVREIVGNKQPHTCEYEARDIWMNWRDPLNPLKRGI